MQVSSPFPFFQVSRFLNLLYVHPECFCHKTCRFIFSFPFLSRFLKLLSILYAPVTKHTGQLFLIFNLQVSTWVFLQTDISISSLSIAEVRLVFIARFLIFISKPWHNRSVTSVCLKGQYHEIFHPLVFSLNGTPGPLIHWLKRFLI
jgi:hypothetical protein